jgi:hypothetical protein
MEFSDEDLLVSPRGFAGVNVASSARKAITFGAAARVPRDRA